MFKYKTNKYIHISQQNRYIIMKQNITITDLKIKDIKPTITDDREIASLLPTVLIPQTCQFTISGINTSIANAIRRTIDSEVLVKCMTVDREDIDCNSPFFLFDAFIRRIKLIPIHQSVDNNATFKINVTNNSKHDIFVRSSDIITTKGGKAAPINETFEILKLEPGMHLTVENIKIKQGYGYESDGGGHKIGLNPVALPLDVEPYNGYENKGTPSSISNPTKFLIKFNTNGTIKIIEFLKLVCDTIIERLENLRKIKFNKLEEDYKAVIEGESHTLGNLYVQTALILYPDIKFCTYNCDKYERNLNIIYKESGIHVDKLTNDIIDHNIEIIKKIIREINK